MVRICLYITYIPVQQLIGGFTIQDNVRAIHILSWHTFTYIRYFGLMKYVTSFRKYVFHHSIVDFQLFVHWERDNVRMR